MKLIRAIVSACALIAASPSFASVIYNFTLTAPETNITTASGSIELTDAAAASGHVDYQFCLPGGPCRQSDPDSPILRFQFEVNNGESVGPLAFWPVTGLSSFGTIQGNGIFKASFGILGGAITNLFLEANDSEQAVTFSGSDKFSYSADNGACFRGCTASGAFAIALAEIPEPASPILVVAAFAAAAFWRRRT